MGSPFVLQLNWTMLGIYFLGYANLGAPVIVVKTLRWGPSCPKRTRVVGQYCYAVMQTFTGTGQIMALSELFCAKLS